MLDTRSSAQPRRSGEVVLDLSGTPAATASAVVLNVTAASPLGRGLVVAHPTGTPRPETSNVNFEAGQTQANEVVVAVGPGGQVTLDVQGGSTGVVVDLVGLVRPVAAGGSTTGTASGGYTALRVPLRAADTRTGLGLPAGRVRGSLALRLPEAVPASATGVVLNVTAVGGTAPGHVVVSPTGGTLPPTSDVNFPVGRVQANEALSRLGSDRSVTITLGGAGDQIAATAPAAHLVVDVVGYTTVATG